MARYALGNFILTDKTSIAHTVRMTNVDFPTNAEITGDDSGSLYDETLSLTNWAPVATLNTKALNKIFSLIDLDGACVKNLDANYNLWIADLIARKLETCDTPLSATPHIQYRAIKGLLRYGTLTANRNEDADLSLILDTFTPDNTNGPVAVTDGVALFPPGQEPSAAPVNERFRLGLSKFAGVQLPDNSGVSIAFNVSITDKLPSFGSIWPDTAGVITVRPVVTITGQDLSKVKAGVIELGANPVLHTNSEIWLIKLKHSGSYEDFTSNVHIKMTLGGLMAPEMLYTGSGGGTNATNTLTIPLAWDGQKVPIAIELGQQYNPVP